MSGLDYFFYCLKNYANFEGRARRSEYWYYTLFNTLIYIVLTIVLTFLSVQTRNSDVTLLVWVWQIAVLLPTLGVGVRRLHDVGCSGWWLLIGLIPIFGAFFLLYHFCLDSDPGDNQYGPNPKGIQPPYGQ